MKTVSKFMEWGLWFTFSWLILSAFQAGAWGYKYIDPSFQYYSYRSLLILDLATTIIFIITKFFMTTTIVLFVYEAVKEWEEKEKLKNTTPKENETIQLRRTTSEQY